MAIMSRTLCLMLVSLLLVAAATPAVARFGKIPSVSIPSVTVISKWVGHHCKNFFSQKVLPKFRL